MNTASDTACVGNYVRACSGAAVACRIAEGVADDVLDTLLTPLP